MLEIKERGYELKSDMAEVEVKSKLNDHAEVLKISIAKEV